MSGQIFTPTETVPTVPTVPEMVPGHGIDAALPWFVMQVSSGRETLAEERLGELLEGSPRRDGEAVRRRLAWSPREHRIVRASRHAKARRRTIELSMLPGYCLIAVEDERLWPAVMDVRCPRGGGRLVWEPIRVGNRPARVPESDMLGLIVMADRLGAHAAEMATAARRRFKGGERVPVLAGPFAGMTAKIDGMKGVDRVRALLPMFGSLRLTTLPVDVLGDAA